MKDKFKVKRQRKPKTVKAKVADNTKKINELVKENKQSVENKIQGLRAIYDGQPKSQQSTFTGPLYYYNACLGKPASTWIGPSGGGTPNYTGLEGFTWGQGVGSDQRIGRYLYFKHTTAQLRLNMTPVVESGSPTQFRIVVFKAKRNAAFGTSGGNPNNDLFLNNSGTPIGLNVVSVANTRSFEFMNMLVNKRNYNVYMDKKVVLQPTLAAIQGGSNVVTPFSTSYPPEYNTTLKLKHEEKVSFAPGNFSEPQDSNYQYCISVISAPYGSTSMAAEDWKFSMRGTVSCVDS